MRSRILTVLGGAAIALTLAAVAVTAQTTSVTVNGITVTFPGYPTTGPALASCDPSSVADASKIVVSNLPVGASVTVVFQWAAPGGMPTAQPMQTFTATSSSLEVPVVYPADTSLWPAIDPVSNERSIEVSVLVSVSYQGTNLAKINKMKWWIKCTPPSRPKEGCTPGYWRQDQHFDSWVTYSPGDSFGGAFSVTPGFSPSTLLDAVWLGGGGENALARHAVAALLNSTSSVAYAYTTGEVIAMVQNAYATSSFEAIKDLFAAANEAGCPLN